jgi:GNAT superfamily N-acetyltransferase
LKGHLGIEIRAANRGDVPIIAEFIRKLAEYERLADEVALSEEQLEETLFGERKFGEVLLAYVEGSPVGFAIYYFGYSTFLAQPVFYLEDLFVLDAFRRKGVGKRLFGELLEIARKERCGRFEWSVLDWNQSAIDFYESIGARAQKEWVRYRLEEKQIKGLLEGGFS